MTVTVATLVDRVRSKLYGAGFEEEWRDVTTTTINSTSSTSIYVKEPTGWGQGDLMELQDTGEIVRVTTGGTNPIKVRRGARGTTAALHNSNGIQIVKNAVWGYMQISDAITETLNDLWPYAWKKSTATLTPVATTIWYDLAATVTEETAIAVTQKTVGTYPDVVRYGAGGRSYRIATNLPASVATSGTGITFPGGLDNVTNSIYVDYRAVLTSSDIADGLMADTVVYGTCWALAAGRQMHYTWENAIGKQAALNSVQMFRELYDLKRLALERQLKGTIPRNRRYVAGGATA